MREPITLILRIELANAVANPLPTCQLAGMQHHPTSISHWLRQWRTDPAMTIGKYDEAGMMEMRAVAELMPTLNGFLKKSVDSEAESRLTQPATSMCQPTRTTRLDPAPLCGAHDVAIRLLQSNGAGSSRVSKPATTSRAKKMEPGGFEPRASVSLRDLVDTQRQFLNTVELWLEGSSHAGLRA